MTENTLAARVNTELKEAMMSKQTTRLNVLRGIKAAITNELVAKGKTPQDSLTDEEIVAVISRIAKQRKDSIEQFRAGGREELVAQEEEELGYLQPYLPQLMSKEEVLTIAQAKKAELAIDDISKKGLLMAAIMKDLKGKADGSTVKEAVDSLF